ncbi:MAG: hypothetical protein WBL93_11805 [Lutisporaceae bacterium]
MNYISRNTLFKLIAIVFLNIIVTAAAIAGYLLYKDTFNSIEYSNWLFYAAIAYIALAIIPLFDVLTSSNDVSFKFGEFAVKGKIDNQSRLDDILSKKSYKFTILMIIVSIFLFIISAITDRFF